jgi:hypothetical protein
MSWEAAVGHSPPTDVDNIACPFLLLHKHSFPKEQGEREKNTLLLIRPCESHPLHISYATSMEEALGLSLQASAASLAAGGWLGGRVLESRLARLQGARATVSGLATAGVQATFSGSTAQRRRGGLGRLSCSPTGESGRWQGGAQAAA